jgi:hypothetical protein
MKINKANQDVRKVAKDAGVPLWVVANRLGLHESVLSRMLRFELPDQRKSEIMATISKIAEV